MKEITRRLYTKPVMLGLAFVVGIALVIGLFVTTKSEAQAGTVIPAGDDLFETTGDGSTYHDFTNEGIPQGTFTSNSGSPSLEFNQLVTLQGKPLSTLNDIDTVIHRNNSVTVPGTTSLTMTQLSLESIAPITITYANGDTENWRVHVSLSALKSSTGSMTIEDGGTFDSTLKVWPKFTFTSELNGDVVVYDTGAGSGLMASSLTLNESADTSEEPVPLPQPTVAPCPVATDDTATSFATVVGVSDASSSSSCPPVTLTSNNSPWQLCNGKFCIPRPIPEEELWARHLASPPGTKKKIAVKVSGTASH